jgi:hypothetical protein
LMVESMASYLFVMANIERPWMPHDGLEVADIPDSMSERSKNRQRYLLPTQLTMVSETDISMMEKAGIKLGLNEENVISLYSESGGL